MKRYVLFATVLWLATWQPAFGQQDDNPAKRIAPLVTEQTVAVLRVNVEKVDLATFFNSLKALDKKKIVDWKKFEQRPRNFVKGLRACQVRELFVIIYPMTGRDEPLLFAVPVTNPRFAAKVLRLCKVELLAPAVIQEKGFVIAGGRNVKNFVKQPAVHNPLLASAFASVANADVQWVAVPGETLRKLVLKTAPPRLPPPFDNVDPAALVKSFRWGAYGLSFKPALSYRGIIQMTDAASAKKIYDLAQVGMNLIDKLSVKAKSDSWLGIAQLLRKTHKLKVVRNHVVINADGDALMTFAYQALVKVHLAAARVQSSNNLRQIAIALHHYHDLYRKLPAVANYDRNGRPLLSWRVHILPFVQGGKLYKQFRLNEPWNSPHNKKLIAKMPTVFRSPLCKAKPGHTTYLAPVGTDTIFGKRGSTFAQIRDGTSNTLFAVEADDDKAVIWTKPADLPIDPKNPHRGLGNNVFNGILCVFADGSVRLVERSIDARTLNHLFQKSDGNVVNLP